MIVIFEITWTQFKDIKFTILVGSIRGQNE